MDERRDSAVKFTYDDYVLLPEDQRCELIEGEFVMTPAPFTRHQIVSQRLEYELMRQVARRALGQMLHAPTDVVLSRHTVVQPDILVVVREHTGIIEKAYVRAAPDLVVEILSTGDPGRDRKIKRKLYFKYGVREYWIVDPDACTVEVCVRGRGQFRTVRVWRAPEALRSPLFPKLRIRLGPVFA